MMLLLLLFTAFFSAYSAVIPPPGLLVPEISSSKECRNLLVSPQNPVLSISIKESSLWEDPEGRFRCRVLQRAAKKEADPEILWKFARPSIALTDQEYGKRRDWPQSFREKLKDIAIRYLHDSVYIQVYETATQEIVGTLRLIRSPYAFDRGKRIAAGSFIEALYGPKIMDFRPRHAKDEKGLIRPPIALPEAEFLNIEFLSETIRDPRNDKLDIGMDIEVGTFAIKYSLPPKDRAKIWSELWLQMARVFFTPPIEGVDPHHSQMFHTYADRASLKMYLPLGFDFLRRYKREGKLVEIPLDERPSSIIADGKEWWPIVLPPHSIMQVPARKRNLTTLVPAIEQPSLVLEELEKEKEG